VGGGGALRGFDNWELGYNYDTYGICTFITLVSIVLDSLFTYT